MKLVVVESPGKIKKIQSFLPSGYRVAASFGHVRDLPQRELGIEFTEDGQVKPAYKTLPSSSKHAKALKLAAQGVDEVLLATDPDREGEAIAWHVRALLGPRKYSYRRIIFNEITKSAVLAGISAPREIDMDRVNAQQARRLLDRLVGWGVSPFCWRRIGSGTSAGRVQSVAVRLVSEREDEIRAFEPETYFELIAWLREAGSGLEREPLALAVRESDDESNAKKTPPPEGAFKSKLIELAGKKIERGLASAEEAQALREELHAAGYSVEKAERKERKRRPPPPFVTSTMQQAASNRYRWKPRRAMQAAQKLYEAGLITYMRTDAPAISKEAMAAVRSFMQESLKPEYVPAKPRYYKAGKGAQEAHECVRPTDPRKLPKDVEHAMRGDEGKLYRLIWERFVASQMTDAIYDDTKLLIGVEHPKQPKFQASGSVLRFKGWLWLSGANHASSDKAKKEGEDEELPLLNVGDPVDLARLDQRESQTKPPARFNQASLIRALEKEGIGRPATYAAIMDTIISRGYIEEIERNALASTHLGDALTSILKQGFEGHFIEVGFTREAENALDAVAEGKADWQELVLRFRDDIDKLKATKAKGVEPFKDLVDAGKERNAASRSEREELEQKCPKCNAPLIRIKGSFGSFIACSKGKEVCNFSGPDLTEDQQKIVAPVLDTPCPQCNGAMWPKESPSNDQMFLSCLRYPECKGTAPVPGSEGSVSAAEKIRGGPVRKKTRTKKAGGASSYGAKRSPSPRTKGFVKKGSRKKPPSKSGKPSKGRGSQGEAPADGPSPECSLCNSRMTLRRSAHGPFWGCSNYPNCKNTLNASE